MAGKPYRRKYGKRKRKTYKKRSYRKANFSMMRAPAAPTLATKLRYYTPANIDPAAGVAVPRIFRANSLYDPDYLTGGSQPRGFDELMVLYNHYTVVGSKITVTFANHDTAQPVIVGIHVSTDPASTGPIRDFIEQGNVKYKVLSADTGAGNNVGTITEYASIKKEFGLKNIMDNHNLRGDAGANPNEELFFNIFAAPQDDISNPGTTRLSVLIEYLVVFSEPNDLTGS